MERWQLLHSNYIKDWLGPGSSCFQEKNIMIRLSQTKPFRKSYHLVYVNVHQSWVIFCIVRIKNAVQRNHLNQNPIKLCCN